MSGQIQIGSAFGQAIREIALNPKYHTICEVGTWNGLGSTACLYSGIQHRNDARLYSIEGNRDMYQQAYKHWKNAPNVTLLYGTLHRNIMTRSEIENHALFRKVDQHYFLHYESEYASCVQSPVVDVPPCDVIVLDGGEFSTRGDWEVLQHPNTKVVVLDDTQVIKTNEIRSELLASSLWICTRDEPNDRNGWAIFVRNEESPDI